jgi:hypothetical protein
MVPTLKSARPSSHLYCAELSKNTFRKSTTSNPYRLGHSTKPMTSEYAKSESNARMIVDLISSRALQCHRRQTEHNPSTNPSSTLRRTSHANIAGSHISTFGSKVTSRCLYQFEEPISPHLAVRSATKVTKPIESKLNGKS